MYIKHPDASDAGLREPKQHQLRPGITNVWTILIHIKLLTLYCDRSAWSGIDRNCPHLEHEGRETSEKIKPGIKGIYPLEIYPYFNDILTWVSFINGNTP